MKNAKQQLIDKNRQESSSLDVVRFAKIKKKKTTTMNHENG